VRQLRLAVARDTEPGLYPARVPRAGLIPPLVAALVAAALAAAPAYAGPPRSASDPVAAAVARATTYWHGTPCGGRVGVVNGAPGEAPVAGQNVPGLTGSPAAMWATFRAPGVAGDAFAASPSVYTECVVHINQRVWPGRRFEDAHFAVFCKEMLHEYGHFEGYPDAGAHLGTIEYERPDLARVPLCERFRLVYGHKVYMGAPRGA
jgi:hypothetical protein